MQRELAELNEQNRQRQLLVKQSGQQLATLRRQHQQARQRLQRRLVATYRLDPAVRLDILFRAETLPELLTLQDGLERLLEHDRQLLADYHQQIDELKTAARDLSRKQVQQSATAAQLGRRRQQLAAAAERQQELRRRAANEELLYQRARQRLKAAISELTANGR